MSHYRELNKELVEQVQTMRKNMKLYTDEIVHLKGELMQKHESEVFLRKQCYNWAVNNFVQLIQSVQPDSDILPILTNYIRSQERMSCASTSSTERIQSWQSRRSSDTRRRSSLLTRELQRSNSVINLRKSLRNASPIRRNSRETSDEEEKNRNSQSMSSDFAEEESTEAAANEAIEMETAEFLKNPEIEDIIFEESDEGEENNCDYDMDVESVNESIDEVSPQNRSAFNDITNSTMSTRVSTKENFQDKNVGKKTRSKKTKKSKFSDKENTTEEYTTSKEDSDIEITKKANKIRQTKLSTQSNKDIEEETLQEPRRYTNRENNYDTNKSFPINQNNSIDEVTLNSNTLINSNITLRNFKDAACSTPNSRQNSLGGGTPTATNCDSESTVSNVQTKSINTTTARPSRKCKPTNLSEPHIGTKLRNESEEGIKKRRYRKVKPKTKTKK